MNKEYLEINLPGWLSDSIRAYIQAEEEQSTLVDCYYCELQSDINVAEVENIITSEQAGYLRDKYLVEY